VSKPIIPEDLQESHDFYVSLIPYNKTAIVTGAEMARLIERVGRVEYERDSLRNRSLDRDELEFTHELMGNLGLECIDPTHVEWKVLRAKTWRNSRAEKAERERDEANAKRISLREQLTSALNRIEELKWLVTFLDEDSPDYTVARRISDSREDILAELRKGMKDGR
jgi:hypothetical protein